MTRTPTVPIYPEPGVLERALDLIFPPLCVGCRKIGRWICARCWPTVPWMFGWECGRCGKPSVFPVCARCKGTPASLDTLVAVAQFEGIGREAVHVLKYHDRHAISGMMGKLMAQAVLSLEVDVVAAVPLHRSRRRERGYDQSAMLAMSVARSLGRPHVSALERTRATRQQASLDGAARHANVAGAFRSKRVWNGERILLVDDVSTTGATMNVAAEALKSVGAGPIVGLVFAHAR